MKYAIVVPSEIDDPSHIQQQISNQSVLPDKVIIITNQHKNKKFKRGTRIVGIVNQELKKMKDFDYDFIVKMDADITIPSDFFENIVRYKDNSHIGIISANVFYHDETPVFPKGNEKSQGCMKIYSKKYLSLIDYVIPEKCGWDSLDVDVAKKNGMVDLVIQNIKIHHIRKIGSAYSNDYHYIMGKTFKNQEKSISDFAISTLKMLYIGRASFLKLNHLFYGYFGT